MSGLLRVMAGVLEDAAAADVLTLSGRVRTAFRFNNPASLQFQCETDGLFYEQLNATARVQINTADDWVRPAASAPGAFECRFTGFTGTALDVSTQLVNIWHPLSTSRFIWTQSRATAGTDGPSAFTIELRTGASGGAEETGAYSMTATREDF